LNNSESDVPNTYPPIEVAAAAPGIYRWVSLFNVYDTVFDGVRYVDVK
jgi:hypothetical protein